tara:strand:- start:39 stop:560 length:522 start_codon:yes stop_codon:yes gene_type:complete
MQKRTVYYKERPLDDFHFYNGMILDKVRIVQYPTYFEGGTTVSLLYDKINHDRLIPASERNDGIVFKKDLKISLIKGTTDGIFKDNFYNFISCVSGCLFLNVTNMIPNTENYKKSETFILSNQSSIQVMIPPLYEFAYKALEDSIVIDKLAYESEETFSQQKLELDTIKIDWP